MRVGPGIKALRHGFWLGVLAALPAAAATPTVAIDMTHQLTTLWVPATAYGLTLIAAVGRGQK